MQNRYIIIHQNEKTEQEFAKSLNGKNEALAYVRESFGPYTFVKETDNQMFLESIDKSDGSWSIRIHKDNVVSNDIRNDDYIVMKKSKNKKDLIYDKTLTSKETAINYIKKNHPNAIKKSDSEDRISFEETVNNYTVYIDVYIQPLNTERCENAHMRCDLRTSENNKVLVTYNRITELYHFFGFFDNKQESIPFLNNVSANNKLLNPLASKPVYVSSIEIVHTAVNAGKEICDFDNLNISNRWIIYIENHKTKENRMIGFFKGPSEANTYISETMPNIENSLNYTIVVKPIHPMNQLTVRA